MAHRTIDPNKLPSNDMDGGQRSGVKPVAASAHTKQKNRSVASEIRHIVNDLFLSVVIPSTKTMLYEFLNGGLQQMILGKASPSSSRGLPGYNPYHSMYSPHRSVSTRGGYLQRAVPTASPINEDIYFDYEDEALLVLAAMIERIATHGRVSVMDMYNLCRLPSTPIFQRYVWTDLSVAEVVATNEGWIITLPRPEYI